MQNEKMESIKEFLLTNMSPSAIYVFGSVAKGHAREDSDIDIAVLLEKEEDVYDVFMLAQELASILDQDVDLVQLKTASTVFQVQIISEGQVLYCADDIERVRFEALVYKMYARLNEERQVIFDHIRESGSVYD